MSKQLSWLNGGFQANEKASCNPVKVEACLLKPYNKPNRSVRKSLVSIQSDKRSTAGFHIYPEYEEAVKIIALFGRHRNKGKALEYLVEFYLSNLPEEKLKHFLRLMDGEEVIDHLLS